MKPDPAVAIATFDKFSDPLKSGDPVRSALNSLLQRHRQVVAVDEHVTDHRKTRPMLKSP
jgi:hypothetical protein